MSAPVPVPRTAVPLGITDPVEKARAELKAALAAIEEKGNLPRRAGRAVDKRVAQLRDFSRTEPVLTAVAVVGAAVGIGVAVWGAVRLYVR
ncbi:hypothetical protein F6J84_13760 [Microbacterium caowuchunii]|uniref:hypothetical protein n=1 Tax=Microbacterium caowuchunii TaxID=2614638 RepID=UPI001244711E|nr:hypothetical protein [Microbacterium caowuchunii]QEW01058.1 hypothetical protein F6J84_13760 [Microbacterium caowuchunii]